MQLLGIVGTNASFSYNRHLLQAMKKQFAADATIQIQEIKDLPLFNEDLVKTPPKAVSQLFDRVQAADGVIFATPEYDHAMPAALKSALEWLSTGAKPLQKKPAMIVGTSYGPAGTLHAQLNLHQVLDSVNVGAYVLPSNEFALPNCKTAFDGNFALKPGKALTSLSSCFHNFLAYIAQLAPKEKKEESEMSIVETTNWDAVYDVLVLGFGGAGATAARFAADAGAKVLVVDSAPEGHEGGNTRYAGQIVGTGEDFDQLKAYYQALTKPFDLDEDMLDTYVDGMVNMKNYFQQYLGVKKPFSIKHDWDKSKGDVSSMTPEYPEYPGGNSYDILLVHNGLFDSALWKNLRQQVVDRSGQIDVWYRSPAQHLIQDPASKAIVGAVIEHNQIEMNIQATRGVVLATGGFENNPKMIQDYLGASALAPLGSMYNKGAGVAMAEEVGADLWHMNNWESLGIYHGMTVKPEPHARGKFTPRAGKALADGSIFVVGDDGSRYFNEAEDNRHGHLYDHGTWRIPSTHQHPYAIYDSTQKTRIEMISQNLSANFENLVIKADTLEDLAKLIHVNAKTLNKTREHFDHFVDAGEDYAYGRDVKTMRKFDDGPYYALPLQQTMLNTQGGPRRNARSEVLAPNGQAIPHLYSAGELGGICANQYQGGNNLAECLIFGKIAGQNAARPKSALPGQKTQPLTAPIAVATQAAPVQVAAPAPKPAAPAEEEYPTGPNQYIGRSAAGMGNEIVVRVTYENGKIEDVEVLKQTESGDIGLKAVEEIPKEMVAKNSVDVDAISGASVSSNALKEAVQQAISKAQNA